MRKRFGRRRTFSGSVVVLGLGTLAVIALLIRRRTSTNAARESYSPTAERFGEKRGFSQIASEGIQQRGREEPDEALAQGVTEKTGRSTRDDISSIIRESVSRSEVTDRAPWQAGAPAPRAGTDVEELAIENYDSLNVKQIAERLEDLVVEEIERLWDYETKHKNRRTLIARFERRVKGRAPERTYES